jgi:hypothetical protein
MTLLLLVFHVKPTPVTSVSRETWKLDRGEGRIPWRGVLSPTATTRYSTGYSTPPPLAPVLTQGESLFTGSIPGAIIALTCLVVDW